VQADAEREERRHDADQRQQRVEPMRRELQ
jgi:hypothetical protein